MLLHLRQTGFHLGYGIRIPKTAASAEPQIRDPASSKGSGESFRCRLFWGALLFELFHPRLSKTLRQSPGLFALPWG